MNLEQAYTLITEKLAAWVNGGIAMLPNLLLATLIVLVAVAAGRLSRRLTKKLLASFSDNASINSLVSTLVHIGVLAVGLFVALGVLRLDKTVTSLLAGAGIVGLALGFAFQDIAANFIAGVIMAVRKPIALGDVIESNGHFGTVTTINLRSTELRTPQGQMVLVPNKDVFQQSLVNYSVVGQRRVDLAVGVSYGDDLAKVREVTLAAVRGVANVLQDPPVELWYTGFGDSSINFEVCYWVDYERQAQYRAAVSDGVMAIKRAFDEHDITIPFPIRTLDFGIKGGERLAEVLDRGEAPRQEPR